MDPTDLALTGLRATVILADVEEATLEPGGALSVIRTEQARELQKRDLDRALRGG